MYCTCIHLFTCMHLFLSERLNKPHLSLFLSLFVCATHRHMAVLRNWMCLLQLCITAAKPLLLLRLRSQYKPPSSFPTPKQRCAQIRSSAAHYVGEFKVGQCCSGAVCVCTGPSLRRLLPALTHWTRVPLIRLLPLAACQTPGEEACSRAGQLGLLPYNAPLPPRPS